MGQVVPVLSMVERSYGPGRACIVPGRAIIWAWSCLSVTGRLVTWGGGGPDTLQGN